MTAKSWNVCVSVVFVCWLISILSHACHGNEEMASGEGGNVSGNSTRFEILPGLYGVIAATGLILLVVTTLVCCTMILVHCKILPQKAKVTLHKLRQREEEEEEEEEEEIPEPCHPHISLVSHCKIPTSSIAATSASEDRHHLASPDNGLLLVSKQTTV